MHNHLIVTSNDPSIIYRDYYWYIGTSNIGLLLYWTLAIILLFLIVSFYILLHFLIVFLIYYHIFFY